MPYQCSGCNRTFSHLAKSTLEELPQAYIDLKHTVETTGSPIQYPAIQVKNITEKYVCPFCGCLDFAEVVEEKQGAVNLADVESLIDCPPNEADTHLKEGYVLFQTWQKNVFLVKLKPKAAGVAPKDAKPDVLGNIIRAGIADAKTAEAHHKHDS